MSNKTCGATDVFVWVFVKISSTPENVEGFGDFDKICGDTNGLICTFSSTLENVEGFGNFVVATFDMLPCSKWSEKGSEMSDFVETEKEKLDFGATS